MKNLYVLRHTTSEDLGAAEERLRALGLGVNYQRPLSAGKIPTSAVGSDGLIVLGAGAWGTIGERTTLPTLEHELRFAYDHLKRNRPLVGFGLGAQILSIAAGGGSEAAPARFHVGTARRVKDDALGGLLPKVFPYASFVRDRPLPPDDAEFLALDEEDQPLMFQIGPNVLGMTCNPGFTEAMLRGLIAECEASSDEASATLRQAAAAGEMAAALAPITDGMAHLMGWKDGPGA